MKVRNRVFLAFGSLILIGFFPAFDAIETFSGKGVDGVGAAMLAIIILCQISSAFPLILAVFKVFLRSSINPTFSAVMCGLIFVFGILFSLFGAAFSSSGSLLILLEGLMITFAVSVSVLIMSDEKVGPIGMLALLGPTMGAIWSVASVGMIVADANRLAGGNRFCLANHDTKELVDSFWDLRGFTWVTTRSGYKSTSELYFHGVLIIGTEDGSEIYNWSPSQMRFDRVENPHRLRMPINYCIRKSDFWSELI